MLEAFISAFLGLIGGLASVAIWEGWVKRRMDQRAAETLLASEIAWNVRKLQQSRRSAEVDPAVSIPSLGSYDTLFQALTPNLGTLGSEMIGEVVGFYRALAHFESGLRRLGEHPPQGQRERISTIEELNEVAAALIEDGQHILKALPNPRLRSDRLHRMDASFERLLARIRDVARV